MKKRRDGAKGFFPCACLAMVMLFFLVGVTTPSYGEAPKEILVGGTISVTGPLSKIVGPFKKLASSWQDLINEQGGIWVRDYKKRLPVRFITYDDKSDQATSLKYYERLVTVDKVNLLIGPFGSHNSFPAATVAESHKIPMVMVCASDRKLFERDYKWSVSQLDEADLEHVGFIEMAAKSGKVKTIAMIGEDKLHCTGSMNGAAKRAEELGLQIVMKEIIPGGTKDFTSVIIKIKGLKPDVVFVEAFPGFEIPFMKQAIEMGLRPNQFFNGHIVAPLVKVLGKYVENLCGSVYWAPGFKFTGQEDYQEILKKTGITWEAYMESSIRMQAYQTIKEMIEVAGSLDRAKLNKAMHEMRYMTVSGPVEHKKGGMGSTLTYSIQIQNGRFVPVWPKDVATGKWIYPTKW
ncbi:MAG: amino acid ABC transporter substrate-binding protein [Proteobacteria bacterium]|nr:amino acid ABC transporter substrate-binding protein [Desulfobacteraceae bacterium]MBU0734264.1 amino acid ABC transporter substrate-binding protein [Pseudomonadota bacterium]MBU0990835.1 amino acid ABC transporter substrate-binding protein [Pseudomonadota bacterium]MBU1904779.1 amino acid ABC transporter substrate-binding protein [Pseudomonadota bacterium]